MIINIKAFKMLGLFLIFSTCAFAQKDSAIIAGQIIKMEQELANALPVDSTVWSKYLDKNWHIVDEDGKVSSRSEFLKTFSPMPKEVSLDVKVTRPVFSFHDNIVVIQYVADEHETTYGQHLHTTYGTMDVWYRSANTWTMLSMQDFEIPALPPHIKVPAKQLLKYIGVYKLAEGHTAMVTLKNDTLYIQKGTGKPSALFAETVNVFFRQSDARGRKIFVLDKQGKMEILERRNGQDVIWRKIN